MRPIFCAVRRVIFSSLSHFSWLPLALTHPSPLPLSRDQLLATILAAGMPLLLEFLSFFPTPEPPVVLKGSGISYKILNDCLTSPNNTLRSLHKFSHNNGASLKSCPSPEFDLRRPAMKRLPEKLMMAAIILSCGFVAHSEPSAQSSKVKLATLGSPHTWQPYPSAATSMHSARFTKTLAARADLP